MPTFSVSVSFEAFGPYALNDSSISMNSVVLLHAQQSTRYFITSLYFSFIHTSTVVVTCRLTFASALIKPQTFSRRELGLCVYFKIIIMRVYYNYLPKQSELSAVFTFGHVVLFLRAGS